MADTFAPGVMMDGHMVKPPGWMWVLAFALRGVPWAMAQVETPAFMDAAQKWKREQPVMRIRRQLDRALEEVAELRAKLEEASR